MSRHRRLPSAAAHGAKRRDAKIQAAREFGRCRTLEAPPFRLGRGNPMAKIPSIKGSIVANHAEVLQKYLAKAQVPESVLARRFEPGDLELFAGPIEATRWYDIRLYTRLLEFLRDYDGEGSNQYLIDAGRRSAENLIRARIHQQLEYLRRTPPKERIEP